VPLLFDVLEQEQGLEQRMKVCTPLCSCGALFSVCSAASQQWLKIQGRAQTHCRLRYLHAPLPLAGIMASAVVTVVPL